jgi:hypothetical protein
LMKNRTPPAIPAAIPSVSSTIQVTPSDTSGFHVRLLGLVGSSPIRAVSVVTDCP